MGKRLAERSSKGIRVEKQTHKRRRTIFSGIQRVTGYGSRSKGLNDVATHRWRYEGVAGSILFRAFVTIHEFLEVIDDRYELVT